MDDANATTIHIEEQWVDHPQGRIYACRWRLRSERACSHDSPPIVMVHDSLGCVALWRDFPAALARATGREVIAYDRLGFGRSDRRDARPSRDFVGEEAALVWPVLRQQLGLEAYAVLGHSVGGGMAVHVAADWPSDCEALVTLAAQAFVEGRTIDGLRAARAHFADPARLEGLARYHGDKAAWVLDAWVGTWLDPAFASWTLADVLPRVRCPVLALHGELDEYGSPRHAELIARAGGGAGRAEILAGTGHMPQREQPERTLELIAQFLRQSRPR